MIKQISDNKWYVEVGSGSIKKAYVVDGTTSTVSNSTLSDSELSALETVTSDSFIVGAVMSAIETSSTLVTCTSELSLLAGHLEHLNISFE